MAVLESVYEARRYDSVSIQKWTEPARKYQCYLVLRTNQEISPANVHEYLRDKENATALSPIYLLGGTAFLYHNPGKVYRCANKHACYYKLYSILNVHFVYDATLFNIAQTSCQENNTFATCTLKLSINQINQSMFMRTSKIISSNHESFEIVHVSLNFESEHKT